MTEKSNTSANQPQNDAGPITAPLPIGGRAAGDGAAKHGPKPRAVHDGPRHAKASSGKEGDKSPRSSKGVAVLVACCLLAALYGGGVFAFSRMCYPNTKVAGADLSWLDRDGAVARVRDSAEDYALEVSGDGFAWTYKAKDASEVIDAAHAVDNLIAHNEPALWPVRLARALLASPVKPADETSADAQSDKLPELDKIELPETFDRDAFLASLGAAIDEFNATRAGTFDAAGAFDPETGSFTLSKALSNRKLDKDAIERAALVAVSTLAPRVELTELSFTPLAGGATEQELQKALDRANELIGTNVNLKMGGAVVATLDGSQLAQWMTFDEALNPTLDTEPVDQWVRDLAKTSIDTVGSERTYTRPDGKAITVSGGTYGWTSDEAQLVQMLQDAVSNKQIGDIEIPLKRSAAAWNGMGKPDWGAYCDIDLGEQHARYYDAAGNLLWESGCITGNPNSGNATPTGVFSLNTKTRNATLIGLDKDKDGEPDYETPVAYWMPFVGNAIGMHDANWQSAASFSNPRAYTWTGSHGCVNLPPDRAAALFDLISKGDCVIVHN